MNCRSCQKRIIPFFSLGDMPSVNAFLKKEDLLREKKYDLTVAFCPSCYLAQLVHTVDPEELFAHYLYFSSVSESFLKHCEKTALHFKKKFGLDSDSLVLEIASNDGAQLQYFKKLGIKILGVDPAKNIAKIANQKGIETIADFFNYSFAKKIVEQRKIQADVIFGANVLAHVPEIIDFVKGVAKLLKKTGTASFEFPYIDGLMQNKFDTIYHEHVFYYSLIALQNIFKQADLEIYDLEFTPTQGKSLRVFICHKGKFPVTNAVRQLETAEKDLHYDKLETYNKIKKNAEHIKKKLIQLLTDLKAQEKTVAGYGAAAKGVILLNYFGINTNYLSFIADKSPAKQGLYAPGIHMLVETPEEINKKSPDYVLILAWNIADEVMKQFADYKKKGGKFIIPIPHLQII